MNRRSIIERNASCAVKSTMNSYWKEHYCIGVEYVVTREFCKGRLADNEDLSFYALLAIVQISLDTSARLLLCLSFLRLNQIHLTLTTIVFRGRPDKNQSGLDNIYIIFLIEFEVIGLKTKFSLKFNGIRTLI